MLRYNFIVFQKDANYHGKLRMNLS